MNHNSDFKYDLKIGQDYETALYELLGSKIEVKRDFKAIKTKNVFIEYYSRGKKSGIATTLAEWWAIWVSENNVVIIKTEFLKSICREYLGTQRDVCGGDMNTSKGILLPIERLINL